MPGDVVVTGFGVLTAFGYGEEALRANVFAGVPGFGPVTRFDASPYRTQFAAHSELRPSQREALGRCAREAIEMAGLEPPLDAATLIGTGGDFDGLNRFWRSHLNGGAPPDARHLEETVPARQADLLAADLGLRGRRAAFTNGCVASSSAIVHGAELIAAGREEVVVAGGCYLVEEEFFAKFDSGRALTREAHLRAFSADRSGLLLGDGAAALVLESRRHAQRRGVRWLAELTAWGMASDAFHVCQPHPRGEGLARAITSALVGAGLAPGALGYVNAHGTGTKLNDAAETHGLRLALGDDAPKVPVSSTKSTTGHALEGSAALEAVISLLVLRLGLLPPTAGYTRADPECDLDYVPNEPRAAAVRHVLSVNSAFGGVNTVLLLSQP
jgi:3-oxoacyl-[acyl-carrier-protein] synthase II